MNKIKVREIFLMSSIGAHENIIKFHGWIEKPHCIKIIVEYLRGGDLKKYIKPDTLSAKQKVKVVLDVSKGLQLIHKAGIIHRDIKAGNISIDKEIKGDETDFTAKIYDFGVSIDQDIQGPTTGIVGTCKYKAPEQSHGQNYTSKVDIFAFAIMTFEIFSEIEAYSDSKLKRLNETQLKMKISQTGLRPNKFVKPTIDTPEEIIKMYERNWDINPENRMDADELVATLEKIYSSTN